MTKAWQKFKTSWFYPYFERAIKTFVMTFLSSAGYQASGSFAMVDWLTIKTSAQIAFGSTVISLLWNWADPNVGVNS